MEEERFDVIIVGAGLAGSIAAYVLAKAGLEVIVLERADTIGGKNVTGGRMYTHALEKVFPNFEEEAPVERKITKERISLVAKEGTTTIEYAADKLGEKGKSSYSILRANFDPWLAEKAEEEGAMFISEIRVDKVIVKDGKACGIMAVGEAMYADVVLLADGVNSLLAQQLGMKKELDPRHVAVGAKEVIHLGEDVINERFGISSDEGVAWLFDGAVTGGNIGGGFIYTDKEDVSVGIVTTIGDIGHSDVAPRDMVDRLKELQVVKPLLEGGKLVEYSAHLVTEAGIEMTPELVRDGVLIAGDAAAFVMNLGFTIRGMDLAIESGRLAAEAIIKAKEKGDFSKSSLGIYETMLKESFVIKDLNFYRKMPAFIENHRLMEDYPEFADEIMENLWTFDGSEPIKFKKIGMNAAKKVGFFNILKDVMKGMGAL